MINKRMCVACKLRQNKSELIKITKIVDKFEIDENYKTNGRSCYVCKSKQCIEQTIKNKLINRAFRQQIDDELYLKLKNKINEVNSD